MHHPYENVMHTTKWALDGALGITGGEMDHHDDNLKRQICLLKKDMNRKFS